MLFIEENNGWEYANEIVDNIRLNYTKNPLVDDYIALEETITELYKTGERISELQINLDSRVLKAIEFLESDRAGRLKYITGNNSVDSLCYCGQSEQYRNCHGLDVKSAYLALLQDVKDILKR